MRVPDDGGSPSYAVLLIELPQEREVGTNNFADSLNNLVQLLLSLSPAAAKLGREAVHQVAFNGAPHPTLTRWGVGSPALLSLRRGWRCFRAFLMNALVLMEKDGSSSRCTPRNFTLLTLFTAAPLCRDLARLLEIDQHFFSFICIDGEVVGSAPHCKLLHLLPVRRLIIVSDEANHCCIICELDNVVGAGSGCTVVCEQAEQ